MMMPKQSPSFSPILFRSIIRRRVQIMENKDKRIKFKSCIDCPCIEKKIISTIT
ncbi:hypothetical protein OIU74_006092 [Salix koriyanagi]|uniref:Uncharacterized protein n=1 Tax=Salix koriyanagi TaxID=2511006 RepID=A0A9Q0ZB56_9ROSI|nr:hypothetical protein OIU74_006092 [Salix koriyanagi]